MNPTNTDGGVAERVYDSNGAFLCITVWVEPAKLPDGQSRGLVALAGVRREADDGEPRPSRARIFARRKKSLK